MVLPDDARQTHACRKRQIQTHLAQLTHGVDDIAVAIPGGTTAQGVVDATSKLGQAASLWRDKREPRQFPALRARCRLHRWQKPARAPSAVRLRLSACDRPARNWNQGVSHALTCAFAAFLIAVIALAYSMRIAKNDSSTRYDGAFKTLCPCQRGANLFYFTVQGIFMRTLVFLRCSRQPLRLGSCAARRARRIRRDFVPGRCRRLRRSPERMLRNLARRGRAFAAGKSRCGGAGENRYFVVQFGRNAGDFVDARATDNRKIAPGSNRFRPYTTTSKNDFQAVHASLRQPIEEYILGKEIAQDTIHLMTRSLCFYGHTHVADIYRCLDVAGKRYQMQYAALKRGGSLQMEDEWRYLVNPGSCGQPRDGNPQARYAILDSSTRSLEVFAVDYDWPAARDAILAAGFAARLGRTIG